MGGTTEWAIDLEQFVDDPDGLVLLELSANLTNAEQCVFPDQSTTTSEEASSERKVAIYIDSLRHLKTNTRDLLVHLSYSLHYLNLSLTNL
jgi:hypothetical protein